MGHHNYSLPIGGPDYIYAHPYLTIPYLVTMTTASIVGSFGNLLILVVIILYKPLRHSRNLFLVNLAAADLVVTGFGDVFSILGKLLRFVRINE